MTLKQTLRKVWKFIWEDDSFLSWIVNVILAFLIVKFIIYPLLGLLLGTAYPVVAVVSGSMEHNGQNFEDWWSVKSKEYEGYSITKENFLSYKYKNGFNKGDMMVLTKAKNIKNGDVIVFFGYGQVPIIHRVVDIKEKEGKKVYQTRGDNNPGSRQDEMEISEERLIGKARIKVPYLGWFKLAFVSLIDKII